MVFFRKKRRHREIFRMGCPLSTKIDSISIIRHPMYFAFIPFMVGTPLLLGSWFGAVFGVLYMLLVARRAVLEERMLVDSLEDYREYMKRVRYRLIPYVW
jgi:protein-S-isoprenylcysteine O-methyltransferase Ste14